MPRDLLRRLPDIRRAEREVAAQIALIGVAKAELFPTFSLKGTINWESFELDNLIESGSNAGAIVPGFRWNILNYGRLTNNVKVQETRLKQTLVNYRHSVLAANTEAADAMSAFAKKQEQISYLKQTVESSREAVMLATKQYEKGKVRLDRVTDLRTDLIQQTDALVLAAGEASLALIRLYKTMGGGWTMPRQSA
ncbi:TolC family protein [Planctomycetes bacterium K23_9]|uniref:TolC family protein n=1 Tax=Stieleria marina TaxID=1930275 RepID=UPI0011A0C1A3